ncbi:cation diffusion facilitator family transporter [Borreliella californiensis]|uniref:Cation diffusion facilitator family transporter n=1 Tax=Borreliella californiensis TaxID=373543 RepID=A0A7X0DP62_9SPIR|nr:cation diffusion facilitator family transporter [Borreliella californiensis]MBB6212730.1 divalent metal cation (Fe/Co/Zn/Cd) transporter/predicted GNAT family acetyltransferase [Borreliella californiensis]WKC91881.1 cation diffusion facilitator family transporter [Borreliella californiensis]WNY70633.1 cation diffusion facilitator family transporter [Borreliella californiensis]
MVKVISLKNIHKFAYLKVDPLKKEDICIVYIENNSKSIANLKAKAKADQIEIIHFYIDDDFKSEGIERIMISNLIHYGKKNKFKTILCQIAEIQEELLSLGFEHKDSQYKKELASEIEEDKFVMGIGIISIFTEVASISSKLTVGILFNSFALIADAFHVMADFVLSTITYFSLKITSKPETIHYPHGHKLMESLIAFIMGIIILIAGFTLFLNTTGLNKFITLGGESGFNLHIHQNKNKNDNIYEHTHSHSHDHNHDHDHSEEDKKNVLEIFSNKSLKKSLWIPLTPFIFFIVKIIEYLTKFQIGKRYNNQLLLALASADKNCIFSHGGITLSLLLATYMWSGFDKIMSIFIGFIIIKEGLNVIINNANNLLSKQNIDLKRSVKDTLKNSHVNFKTLNFHNQGNKLVLYIKINLNSENDFKNFINKTQEIKKIIKQEYKEINDIYLLV